MKARAVAERYKSNASGHRVASRLNNIIFLCYKLYLYNHSN